ncbi:DUF6268 family outer membrane beta-barrel protein [Tenacibaculum ovolyticum]|uniref:DUF6268 family outer membrane beta-barrel protein n=1 Tax=Tenacibaculum ovolyticum TaxID=104270 RepID=UPI001F171120|nr:DUF6268 family outer membrane beta-barrel protein [Tenacibaculum ovolyticum]WBX77623.1 DUF6268 family outer membrane beta-barrel protein [Tenacibaculum ovolyticum]
MIRKKIVIVALFLICKIYGQVTGDVFVLNEDRDMFYLHYTPEIQDNSLYDYQRMSTKFGIPPIVFNKVALYNTIGMDYHSIAYKGNKLPFLRDKEKYYNINYSLLAQYRISRNWSVNALFMPHVVASFNDKMTTDDLNVNGILFAEKRFRRKGSNNYYVLTFGVGYLTLSGETTVNPVVNFMGNINNKITFAVGLPNTYVKYNFNKKHAIKILGDLNDFTANINRPLVQNQPNATIVDRSIFTTVSAGIEYNYWVSKNIGLMIRGTHSVYEKYGFEDANENEVYKYDTKLRGYLSVGIKIKPFK